MDKPPPDDVSPVELDELFALLYAELRRIAHRQRRRHGSQETLSTTALVNEAYVRLKAAGRVVPGDRVHFLSLAARAMRFALVDYARRWSRQKRRPDAPPSREEAVRDLASPSWNVESILAIHEALERLAQRSERMARVVECRFFGGMTDDEIATVLSVSPRTVRGDWQRAKLWLTRELSLGEIALQS